MSSPTTFLSVDIDFFNDEDETVLRRYLDKLTDFAHERGIPISSVTNHQQMLDLVNNSGATGLVNVDYHSDLASDDVKEFECGTWVTYVEERQKKHYHWIHSGLSHEGDCNGDKLLFSDNSDIVNQQRVGRNTGWGKVTHKRVRARKLTFPEKIAPNCVGVCVCSSPSYSSDELIEEFNKWRKGHKINHKRGRNNEFFRSARIPPK